MSRDKIQTPKGMNDVIPPDSAKWLHFEGVCRALFARYGYGEVRTPIVEATQLFARGIGEATDVVEKEMYTFEDRGGRSLTMRPEMTASCARAYIQHSVHKQEPVTRWYYVGPMFRYERMQRGRYRQFYQIGCEIYGVAEPSIDVELIAMLRALYDSLGIETTVLLNSVGDAEDRPAYREALVGFLSPHKDALCADCKRRLETNPLRVLDCKVPTCKDIVKDAPNVLDHLGEASRAHFDAVVSGLGDLDIPVQVTPTLVRGLDYYTGTVFELTSESGNLGSQSTIVAGGRYNNLIESLGGPATPAIGFSIGIERGILCLPDDDASYGPKLDVFFVSHGDAARAKACVLAHQLRVAGVNVDLEHRAVSVKAQFKRANKMGARFVATIGEQELADGTVQLKNMDTSDQRTVPMSELADALG